MYKQGLRICNTQTTHSLINIMIVYYTLVTDTAVYRFQINQGQDQARVTRWILKGNKGAHASTSMTTEGARKLVRQLQAK